MHRQAAYVPANQPRAGVKGGYQVKAVGGEAGVVEDGPAQPADADHRDVPVDVDAQDLPQAGQQIADAVASALLAEPPEIGQILADLGRRHLQLFPQLPRTHHHNAVLHQAVQDAQILRQAADHHFRHFRPRVVRGKQVAGHRRFYPCGRDAASQHRHYSL